MPWQTWENTDEGEHQKTYDPSEGVEIFSGSDACAHQLLLGIFTKRKPLLNEAQMNSHLELAQRNAGEVNWWKILWSMIPTSSYRAIGRNHVWPNVTRRTSPQTGPSQAWAAGPERCVKGGRNTNTGQNIAKSWIIRLSLQANYDFGEDVFSQQDNDPKRCAKAPQNGWKTTGWMMWSQSQDLTTADRLWLLIGIWYEL